MNQKQKGSAHSNAEATLASRLEAGILGDVRIVEIVVFDEVKIALKGGEGGRLSRDLMRLGGTEECSGDAEAGDEEEKGGADHSSAVSVYGGGLGGCGVKASSSCSQSGRCQPVSVRGKPVRTYVRTYVHLCCAASLCRFLVPSLCLPVNSFYPFSATSPFISQGNGQRKETVSVTMKRAAITALLLPSLASAVAGESLLRGVNSPAAGVGGLDNEVAHAHASANGKKPQRRKLADVTNKFQMKLWYTEGIKWEYRGENWCWQCVGQKGCNPGDTIITQPCRDIRAQRWQAVRVTSNRKYVQFRTRNVLSGPDDLCVTRNDEQGEKYELEECDEKEDRQFFRGFKAGEDEKFALNPKPAVDDGRDRCVTMNHRPRSNGDYNGDKIYDQKCWKAEKTDTMYWEIRWIDDEGWEEEDDEVDEDDYDGGDDEKGLRDIDGDVSEPVGRCSGDCDSGEYINECVLVMIINHSLTSFTSLRTTSQQLDGRQTTTVAATSYALSERTVTRARSPGAQRRTAEVVLAGITGKFVFFFFGCHFS